MDAHLRATAALLALTCWLTACGGGEEQQQIGLAATGRALAATQTVLAGEAPTATSPAADGAGPAAPTAAAARPPECSELASQVGSTVACTIRQAHCSYRQDIDGAPTFCNDGPFPRHRFTLLVWGQDWSEFDGRCLIVSGYLSRFEGKPQIVAESRAQVSLCD